MNIVFQHIRNTKNIGDFSCSPYDYFDWPHASAKDIRTPSTPYNASIIGGGKIFGGLAGAPGINRIGKPLHIAWGVGTRQTLPFSLKYWRARKIFDLIGSRDWGDTRYEFAPCVSCMSPLFSEKIEIVHNVVFYMHGNTHKQGIKIPNFIPSMSNTSGTLEEAIKFIGSGQTVVSNSYHGTYWALLLGRRVICVPFSNKFNSYRLPPTYATPTSWRDKIDDATSQPEMLDLCRIATMNFRAKVLELLDTVDSSNSKK